MQCPFARHVWHAILAKLDLSSHCASSDEEVDLAMRRFQGSDLLSRIGRLAFVVTVYFVWMERNQRKIDCKNIIESAIVKEVENFVIAKACTWSVRRSYTNWATCKMGSR